MAHESTGLFHLGGDKTQVKMEGNEDTWDEQPQTGVKPREMILPATSEAMQLFLSKPLRGLKSLVHGGLDSAQRKQKLANG